jgi:neutral ceramidase
LGYVQETFDAWVTGISEAIIAAHKNLQTANVKVNKGMLYGSNINRSPTSYLLNPEDERAQYPEGDTDKTMTLLSIVSPVTSKALGVLNFFAVHGTSMNNTNTLTSGDNRGYASYALEREINGKDVPTGKGSFVAAFASSNLGDVSPNTAALAVSTRDCLVMDPRLLAMVNVRTVLPLVLEQMEISSKVLKSLVTNNMNSLEIL